MKYSWAKLVGEMRIAMVKLTFLEGHDKAHTADLNEYFRNTIRMTDEFHCWDYDYDLERAFNRYPKGRCNYRSIESYWEHKYARMDAEEAIHAYLEETSSIIEDYFADPMNFPPGYEKPVKIVFASFERAAEKMIPKLIRTIKM